MTVPTQEEFADWLALGNESMVVRAFAQAGDPKETSPQDRFIRGGLDSAFVLAADRLLAEPDLRNALSKIIAARREQYRILQTMPAGKWLFTQPHYQSAYRLLNSGRRKIIQRTPDEFQAHLVSWEEPWLTSMENHIQKVRTKRALSAYFIKLVTQDLEIANRFPYRIMDALHQFHHLRTGHRVAEELKEFPKLAKKVQQLTAPLLESAQSLRYASGAENSEEMGLCRAIIELELQLQNALERRKQPATTIPALGRSSERAGERFFIFRVVRACQNHRKDAKLVGATMDLLSLDGFDHVFDVRSVERLIVEFSGKK